MDQVDLNKILSKEFRRKLPAGPQICSEAMRSLLADKHEDRDWIKANFSRLVEEIQVDAYRLYQDYEKRSAGDAFREILGPMLPEHPTKDDFFELLGDNFTALDRFFLGLTQGRRPRAGKAFEQVIQVLFTGLGYPYTPQAKIDGQPDFLLPSEEHYKKFPMDCLIFTAKRTLRERWRQITTEGAKGLHFFLATIDETVRERDLAEMLASRIYLVVPERIEREFYADYGNVISFEKFFEQHLDPAMTRWRTNKVIASE